MDERPRLREVIIRHGLDARKSLGQHFLLDENLTARIVRAAGPLAGRHVIEVGPGPGGLTRALLQTEVSEVVAIEIDPRAVAPIAELAVAEARLRIVEADAMRVDAASLCAAPRQIIANLPYNVGTPLLVGWLRQAAAFERLTLMFQQEVAERICAKASSSDYGRLSVLAQWTCEARIALRIPPSAFVPRPKVDSAIVVLTPHTLQPDPALFNAMERITSAAFGQRRKMLRRSLKPVGGERLLAAAGIDPTRRAETLTVAEFERLAVALSASVE